MSIKDTAVAYMRYGFSVFPVMNKKPVIEWKKYQNEYANMDDLETWWSNGSPYGIAVATGEISNLVVIDVDEIEEAKDILDSLIPDSLEIPTVQTPSGGFHYYFRCPSDKIRNNARIVPGADLRANGGYVVLPPTTNYKWIVKTGGYIPALPQAYINYITQNQKTSSQCSQEPNTNIKYYANGRRDDDLFTVANSLIKNGINPGFVEETLRLVMSSWGENDTKWIKDKIDSAMNRNEVQHDSLKEEIKNYINSLKGEFNVNDIDKELLLFSKQQKNNRSTALSRLTEETFIERIGRRSGNYRKINKETDEIFWQTASTKDAVDVHLPFYIHELVHIFPKNIIIIAGEKDAGKTAFLLNTIKLNMNKHEVVYLSSEMRGIEMAKRLEKFEDMEVKDWNFKTYGCASDFQDKIKPNAINLIDYMEVTDEFWKVAESIRKIYDKLDKGIAIIGLQKKSGSEYARGGEFSMEKSRLYITLQAGSPDKNSVLKIVSAKNPKGDKPSRGIEIEYKLVQGCKFVKQNKELGDFYKAI